MILYRLFLTLLAPLLLVQLGLRVLSGRESRGDLAQRLGAAPAVAADGIWLHGASNGELASARGLLEELQARRPGLPVLVTANTLTARRMVEDWNLPGVSAALAPLDLRWALGRFLRRSRPAALVVIENEFWPNRLHLAARAGIPVIAAGARMSARSASGWARLPGLAAGLMAAIAHLSPQDGASAGRFVGLGLAPERLGRILNLKAAIVPALPSGAEPAELAALMPRGRTLLAASTHEGEEEIVLAAFARLLAEDPDWRLILAPRHPRRADEIAARIGAAGLGCLRRSQGGRPSAATPVWLADTMGEMPLWYGLAATTFVGGSLVDRGGHTPFEPAAQGSAILTGPHVSNAAEAYGRLFELGGAKMVHDAPELAQAAQRLSAPAAHAAATAAARQVLEEQAGGAARQALAARILALAEPRRGGGET